MGKAARWFRSLLGGGGGDGRKDRHQERRSSPSPSPAAASADRKRWSFARSSRDSAEAAAAAAAATEGSVRGGVGGGGGGNAAIARAAEAAWLRSLYEDGTAGRQQQQQSKHAIAVAAATAAAADAAVAAAQAAVEVVRLTSQGPKPVVFSTAGGGGCGGGGGGGTVLVRRAGAAVKIQTAFRGFLAKKALRALKALVKLQALVRGYLVRKQTAATLQSMQALVRAQAAVRAARTCRAAVPSLPPLHHPAVRPRFSLQERYAPGGDDTRSEHGGVAAYSRRMSASIESSYDRSPKIVEMDTARPRSSSRASSLRTTTTTDDEWCPQSVSSPLSCQHHQHLLPPPRIAVPTTARHFPDYDWEKPRPATAQCTPRFAPPTPAKSLCGAGNGGYYGQHQQPASPTTAAGCPGYMSSTQSSEARSQSAPKQRPPEQQPARKRVPLSEVVLQEARASLVGVGCGVNVMQKRCNARAQLEAFDFRAAVVSRFQQSRQSGSGSGTAATPCSCREGGDRWLVNREWQTDRLPGLKLWPMVD